MLPGGAVDAVKLAHDAADGVHLDPSRPGGAAQPVLHPPFDADLADLEARDLQHRVRRLERLEVALGDGADIAHGMREILDHRVMARQADLGGDAGQGGGVGGDAGDGLPFQPLGNGDRDKGTVAHDVAVRALDVVIRQRDQRLQPLEHQIDIAGILAHHDDAIILLVAGDDDPVAVLDQPARGRDQPDIDAVFLGQQAELVGLVELHVAHPPHQRARHCQLHPAQKHGAAGDQPGAERFLAGRPSHSFCPRASTSPVAGLRTPSAKCDTSTARG